MPELPPPLPPEDRTVGQLVAEAMRAYGHRFFRALPLGLPLAFADQLSVGTTAVAQIAIFVVATPLFAAGYLWACALVLERRPTWTAALLAVLIWLPFPLLRAFYIIPGIAWLAFVGLAVPAAMVEGLGFRDALVRGRRLGTADYVHALGSLAALVLVVGIAANTLSALLHSQGDSGQRAAIFLADLVLSPLLFVGGALLYLDQAPRVGSPRSDRRSRRDADLHPPLDADAAGRPDAQVQP